MQHGLDEESSMAASKIKIENGKMKGASNSMSLIKDKKVAQDDVSVLF
jgi:hypothetical protein